MQDFRIVFERPSAIYFAGETVTVKVIIKLSHPKKIRELRMKARGKAKTHWTEYIGKHRHTYEEKEYYFNKSTGLAGNKYGKITLPEGEHVYCFAIPLPYNIPSSFEHKNGYIRYILKAILDIPWGSDYKIVAPFLVITPHNAIVREGLTKAFQDIFEHEFNAWCCFGAGNMTIHVKSQARAFAPTGHIELAIEFNNKSQANVTMIQMELKKRLTFHASGVFGGHTKRKTEYLRNVFKRGPFPKKGEITLRMEVPIVPPSNLEHCSIIEVSYELDLVINFDGFHGRIKRCYGIPILDGVQADQ